MKPGRARQGRGRPISDRRRAMWLAGIAFVIYSANLRVISAGDCYPARFLPLAIWRGATLSLYPVLEAARVGNPSPYWIVTGVDGRPVSQYPIVAPLLVTPLYAPAALALQRSEWREPLLSIIAEVMEKVSASVVASAAVAVVYLLLRRRLNPARALLLTAAFAFGTNTWSTSSQGLWQHGPAELLIALALLCVTGAPTTRSVLGAGLLCGLAAANRPPDALLVGAIGLYGVVWAGRKFPMMAAAAVGGATPFLLYNWLTFRDLGGGYSLALKSAAATGHPFFRFDVTSGVLGLLLSPGRGLFFYAPFLLFLAWTVRHGFRERGDRLLAVFLALGALAQVALYSRADWRGGYSYGPRYLSDMLPILVWLLAPVVAALGRRGLAVFSATVVVSVFVQAVGVFCYPTGSSDTRAIYPKGPGDDAMNVWSISDSPILIEARSGLAPMPFLDYARQATE